MSRVHVFKFETFIINEGVNSRVWSRLVIARGPVTHVGVFAGETGWNAVNVHATVRVDNAEIDAQIVVGRSVFWPLIAKHDITTSPRKRQSTAFPRATKRRYACVVLPYDSRFIISSPPRAQALDPECFLRPNRTQNRRPAREMHNIHLPPASVQNHSGRVPK